jgi:predicted NBD/HSP70 family sugar kinase
MSAITGSQRSLRHGGGTTDQIRDRNLSSILRLVHRDGALSRAELTRRTGLNRSTVGIVVAELVRLGLVIEEAPVVGGAGRPSAVIAPSTSPVAIAINPEVDALHLGVIGLSGRIVRRATIPAAQAMSPAEVVQLTRAAIAGMLAGHEDWIVVGAGVAVPGQVRLADGLVREAAHLGWLEVPLAAQLEEALGVPVWAANAAILALRAESAFGVGRGIDDLFYIIGGPSGIGGGAVADGILLAGSDGHAGEIGHMWVADNGRQCHCGAEGCFETEVRFDELREALGHPLATTSDLAPLLAASTDAAVTTLIARYRVVITRVLRSVVNLFNPSTIVIGGFLAAVIEGMGVPELVGQALGSSTESVQIFVGSADPDLLLIGAAELAFADLLADPANRMSALRSA